MSERLEAVHNCCGWQLERWDATGRQGFVCDHVWDNGEGAEVWANRIAARYNAHEELAEQHARLREVLKELIEWTAELELQRVPGYSIPESEILDCARTALACCEVIPTEAS